MSASLYDFRDFDLMHQLLREEGVTSAEFAEMIGIKDTRAAGSRLAWMRKYGMVLLDRQHNTWSLSESGQRVLSSQIAARKIEMVEKLPDESMVEVMAHVTSRYRHGQPMLAHMLRREFLFGTKKR